MTGTIVIWTVATYLIASVPFSLVVGYLLLGKDIRKFGDGNPGATNVRRAGGNIGQYAVALLADGFKGLFPVGIPLHLLGWSTWQVFPIAMAALLGHAFSVYLGFKGGKAIAVSAGIWIGLIVWEAAIVIPIALVFWFYIVNEDEWAIFLTMISLLAYLLVMHRSDGAMLLIWAINMGLIIFTHRTGQITRLPTLRLRKREQEEQQN